MALRLLWFPSTFSTEQMQQTLSLHKPPSKTLFSSPLSLSSTSPNSHFSSISSTRRRTNLLIFQVSSVTEQQSPSTPTSESDQEPQTRLIAQNIPWSSSAEDIRNLFEKHGNVLDVELSMYNKTRNRGLAFITMRSEEEAFEALNKLDSYEFEGRSISVAHAKAKKKNATVVPVTSTPKYDVFVANLSWKVKSKDLMEFFSSMKGDVVAAEVTYQMTPTRKPTGYAFVSFHTKAKAEEAISAFQGKELMGKPVRMALSNRSLQEESKDGTSIGETSTESNDDKGISENADGTIT